jgi:hypothetical protein
MGPHAAQEQGGMWPNIEELFFQIPRAASVHMWLSLGRF